MLILAVIIITLSFFLQGLIGFGGGIVSIPLLSLFMRPVDAVTLVLIFQFLKGTVIIFNYKNINWKLFTKISISLILGITVGVFFALHLPDKIVRIGLGILVFAYVIRTRYFPTIVQKQILKAPASLMGLVGGIIHGSLGVGGPVFVMFYNEHIKDRISLRATLIATFFIANTLRIGISASTGLIDVEVIRMALYILPFFGAAIFLAEKIHADINERLFRNGMDALLLVSAISLIIKAF